MEHKQELMEWVKEHNPDLYWKVVVEEHEKEHGEHYTKELAEYDISNIAYVDNRGVVKKGEYWTEEQVDTATSNMPFASDINKCDKWVAFNVFHSDTCRVLSDDLILKAAYEFFFNDKDFDGNKIWHYMKVARCH